MLPWLWQSIKLLYLSSLNPEHEMNCHCICTQSQHRGREQGVVGGWGGGKLHFTHHKANLFNTNSSCEMVENVMATVSNVQDWLIITNIQISFKSESAGVGILNVCFCVKTQHCSVISPWTTFLQINYWFWWQSQLSVGQGHGSLGFLYLEKKRKDLGKFSLQACGRPGVLNGLNLSLEWIVSAAIVSSLMNGRANCFWLWTIW